MIVTPGPASRGAGATRPVLEYIFSKNNRPIGGQNDGRYRKSANDPLLSLFGSWINGDHTRAAVRRRL
jgi:hypothetical protein